MCVVTELAGKNRWKVKEQRRCLDWCQGISWTWGQRASRTQQCSMQPFPELGLFLSYCSICITFTPLSERIGELVQNIRLHTPDIFCQLHHLFLPVLSLKGICHSDIPWCLSDCVLRFCLNYSNRALKYTSQLCLGFVLRPWAGLDATHSFWGSNTNRGEM